MSGARKLQTEIDRVMKKVDEGVDIFNEIWEKVYSAEQQNQKEKYEMDLKKEIKKLQRLRDQIKTWISSSEVKDKGSLMDARRLIETKMEQFKVCEKETKTKTYSKEGLARAEKLDPAEEARQKTTAWITEIIDQINQLIEDREVEIERLSTGKGKKTNKHIIEECNQYIMQHKFHINKLEGIMRLVSNDILDVNDVDEIKEDLEYYIEAHDMDDYIQSYDEDIFYETLGLDDLDVVNVDRVTHVTSSGRSKSSASSVGDDSHSETKSSTSKRKESKSKKVKTTSVIPKSIGRARVTSTASSGDKKDKHSDKHDKNDSSASHSNANTPVKSAPTPAKVIPSASSGGASMAAILKRETEQRERQEQAQQQKLLREREQQAQLLQKQQQQQLLQKQQQQQLALQKQEAALREQQQLQAQQQAAAKQKLQAQQAQAVAAKQKLQAQQQQAQSSQNPTPTTGAGPPVVAAIGGSKGSSGAASLESLLNTGLGGLVGSSFSSAASTTPPATQNAAVTSPQPSSNYDASPSYLGALNESYLHMPSTVDSERPSRYTPRNPYLNTPPSFPSNPSPIFDHPAIFEKLGTDALFFVFYYAQGTYQQYLAARALKKQSWRYHKKYMTWFQRHEEPKITTDEYEQGTYVYFDYETGWCQRIKSDFRFEYSYLEDSLII
eukprot:CAMPEP_0178963468 /NCGR_PEP_ID=MMETSP0789-20121207/15045_1 /TAXON_ID=3005 /ORGANISM="Rhizosolenia setigera, Strain CCMP 1694" /LENGTH=666 /DNA_ID=CAMNT_0020647949 /DNA_START=21 /DNA_END=2021 /DNA_ORIENTATION=-